MSFIEQFTRAEWAEMFLFLDGLRKSGTTNMVAGAPFLMWEFGLDETMAKQVLSAWMETFNWQVPASQRVSRLMEAE